MEECTEEYSEELMNEAIMWLACVLDKDSTEFNGGYPSPTDWYMDAFLTVVGKGDNAYIGIYREENIVDLYMRYAPKEWFESQQFFKSKEEEDEFFEVLADLSE